MRRHYYLLLTLLTACVIVLSVYGGFMVTKNSGLPVEVNFMNAHTAVLNPIKGIPLPAGIRPGDQIDLTAQPLATRIVVCINILSSGLTATLPLGHTYDFVIMRDQTRVDVPVTVVRLRDASGTEAQTWIVLIFNVINVILALLIIWRGRNRVALGMAIWAIALVFGGNGLAPFDGVAGLAFMLSQNLCFLLARIGFFLMADAVARPILSPRVRRLYWTVFVLVLLAGAALFAIGGPLLYVFTGWAGGLLSQSGLVWSASYLVPIVLLFSCYQRATQSQRLRLRWMLWSSMVFLAGIVASNTYIINMQISTTMTNGCQMLGIAGFLYAVLRHRVIDVSVFLDRTLVYGTITALVVGVLAAVNSLVQHAALGTDASLLLQVAVPLALGIVLMRVRAYLDRIVERVFFRRKYLADKALRRFAALCAQFESSAELLATAAAEIRRHLGASGVTFYERRPASYTRVHQEGEVRYPEQVKIDDTAFVAARANQNDIDLGELHSGLGSDGHVFPMSAHGEMQYVLVCANRPGEHYSSDERLLLAHVAHEMGMALYALRMQAHTKVVEALAKAPSASLQEIQLQARTLLNTATTG